MDYKISDKVASLKPSIIREILKNSSSKDTIPFSAGNPAAESFPVKEMQKLSNDIYENDSAMALQYGITEGYAPLREDLKLRMKEKLNCGNENDNLIITSGAQQAIDLFTKVMCNEGDTVIVENPSFIGALNAFRSFNVNLVGVELEDDGINIEKLEEALKREKNVKFIYLIPTFNNPMGTTTSLEKRKAIYELAKKYKVLILEDNPYGYLRFKGEEVPTIKSLDTDNLVVYCGTFSKILSAGIRVGYVMAPDEIIQKIVVCKQCDDVHSNLFFQIIAHRYMEEYDIDEHIEKIRSIYRRKSGLMLDTLKRVFGDKVKYTKPEGGLFLWVTLPDSIDMMEFCKVASQNKVGAVPGIAFITNDAKCNSFRLNYSTPSDEQIVKGIEILGKVFDSFTSK